VRPDRAADRRRFDAPAWTLGAESGSHLAAIGRLLLKDMTV
jgi:hypothetical protein